MFRKCSQRIKDMQWGYLGCRGTWKNTVDRPGCSNYEGDSCALFCNGEDDSDGLFTCVRNVKSASNCSELEIQIASCARKCS